MHLTQKNKQISLRMVAAGLSNETNHHLDTSVAHVCVSDFV